MDEHYLARQGRSGREIISEKFGATGRVKGSCNGEHSFVEWQENSSQADGESHRGQFQKMISPARELGGVSRNGAALHVTSMILVGIREQRFISGRKAASLSRNAQGLLEGVKEHREAVRDGVCYVPVLDVEVVDGVPLLP